MLVKHQTSTTLQPVKPAQEPTEFDIWWPF